MKVRREYQIPHHRPRHNVDKNVKPGAENRGLIETSSGEAIEEIQYGRGDVEGECPIGHQEGMARPRQ